MAHASLVNDDWKHVIGRLGGPASRESRARETTAFLRARSIENAVDLAQRGDARGIAIAAKASKQRRVVLRRHVGGLE
jgi:hypothetical protein